MEMAKQQKFVCVIDSDANSNHQLDYLRKNKNDTPIKGLIVCSEKEHSNSQVCKTVPAFPAFCNPESGSCVVGTRTSRKSMDELERTLTR